MTCYFVLCGFILVADATGTEPKSSNDDPTAESRLAEWEYRDRHIERKIKRFVEITQSMTDDKWRFSFVDSQSKRMHAIMSWGNGVGHDGKIRSYMHRPFNVRSSIHTVVLHVKGGYPTARDCSFETFRQDAKDNWAIRISQSTGQPGRLSFDRVGDAEAGLKVRLSFPIQQAAFVIEYQGVAQEFEIDLDLKDARRERWNDLSNVLGTAESMRNAMVADLDTLAAVVGDSLRKPRRHVETRTCRETERMNLRQDGKRLHNLNFGEEMPSPTIDSDAELARAEALILTFLDKKRTFICKNDKILFIEAERTFPVAKWLMPSGDE